MKLLFALVLVLMPVQSIAQGESNEFSEAGCQGLVWSIKGDPKNPWPGVVWKDAFVWGHGFFDKADDSRILSCVFGVKAATGEELRVHVWDPMGGPIVMGAFKIWDEATIDR